MTAKSYSELEQKVINLFKNETQVEFLGDVYSVSVSDKPRPQQFGECKTDVYIQLFNEKNNIELKISCKLLNNEFQENKISAERAEGIFGNDWSNIIQESTATIAEKFQDIDVIYPNGKARLKEGFLTMGWKLEIASKARGLSAPIQLSDDGIRDSIYRGINQSQNKIDAVVNGHVIKNSGIATHMLVTDLESINSVQDVLNKIVSIDNYPIMAHFLIFTGFSYRIKKDKDDGNRPLAVQVKYKANVDADILEKEIIFEHPLEDQFKGRPMIELAKQELNKLSDSYIAKFI